MPCFSPLPAWLSRERTATGKRKPVFSFSEAFSDRRLMLPCNQCIGCRLSRSRMWATRLVHERELHDDALFLTLTYKPEALPPGGTLVKSHFQEFMKRLRERVSPKELRVFWCGEYGEELGRPHYHAILFGFWPDDSVVIRRRGPIFSSRIFSETWEHGFHGFGDVSFESAAYVARYCLKKRSNKGQYTDPRGKVWQSSEEFYGGRLPEFAEPSRRPGIGRGWIERYWSEVYPRDEVVMRGFPQKPPRYYDQWLQVHQPEVWSLVSRQRFLSGVDREFEDPRLRVRELVAEAKIRNLVREFERAEA